MTGVQTCALPIFLSSLPNSYDTLRQIYFVSSLDWTLDDLLSKVIAKEDAKVRVKIFQLTLLNKMSLFLKEAKGMRRKENSKVK